MDGAQGDGKCRAKRMEECRRVLDEVFVDSSSDCNDTVEGLSPSSVSPQPMEVEQGGEKCCWKSMEENQRVLDEVFGASECNDTDEDSSPSSGSPQPGGGQHGWEMVKEIEGLWMCRQFLNSEQQSWLLSSIDREGWFRDSIHNQAMKFGDLPEWATTLSSQIFYLCSFDVDRLSEHCGTEHVSPFPMDLLFREPLFDQLIANVYQPSEGICAHVDLMRFEDAIAIVSLQSSCVMHFTRVEVEGADSGAVRVPVLLTPGSLIIMSGEARYLWKHEINRQSGFQVWDGVEIKQQRRTSITLRKLCPHHPRD